MTSRIATLTLAFALAVPALGLAANYDEGVSGDLSGDRLNPTSISLGSFTNFISGTTVQGDIDYFTVTLPQLSGIPLPILSISLTQFTSTDDLAFLAVQEGSQFTEPPTGTDTTKLLGYEHIGLPLNVNILPTMGSQPGTIGFTQLAGPVYTFWLQQTGPQPVAYTLDIYVTPEPSPLALFAAGLVAWRVGRRFARVRAE